jgi:hypothetical protein
MKGQSVADKDAAVAAQDQRNAVRIKDLTHGLGLILGELRDLRRVKHSGGGISFESLGRD